MIHWLVLPVTCIFDMYANRKEKRRRRVGPQVIPLVCGLIEAGRKVQHPMPTAWKPTSLGFVDFLISSLRTDGPAFSLAPRMKAEKVYVTPAPSTYDMRKPEVVRVRAPAYSLAGRFLSFCCVSGKVKRRNPNHQ